MSFYFVVDIVQFFFSISPCRGSIHVFMFPQIKKIVIDISDSTTKCTQSVSCKFLPICCYYTTEFVSLNTIITFKCCKVIALYSSFPGSNRSNMTLSAPLQYKRIFPFSLKTTDMRRLVLLKSRMQRSSWTLVSPMISTVTLFGVRSLKTTPKFLAAETRADSSGD